MTRSVTKTRQKGIRDWTAKRSLLRYLYHVTSDTAVVHEVLGAWFSSARELQDVLKTHYDAFRKWDRSTPTGEGAQRFWDQIISDKKAQTSLIQLVESSVTEFAQFFAEHNDMQAAVADLLRDRRVSLSADTEAELRAIFSCRPRAPKPVGAGRASGEYYLRVHEDTVLEGPLTGIRSGVIRVEHLYNSPESAAAWSELVDSQNYRMFSDCLLSLKQLVAADFWKEAVDNGRFSAVVSLGGGGAPEKDWELAMNLGAHLKEGGPALDYVIVDISKSMIDISAPRLQQRLRDCPSAQAFELHLVERNFLALDHKSMFPRDDKWRSVVWAILGGTIGNVKEEEFLRSINGPSMPGDLLIVGVDTIDESRDGGAFAERMNAVYRSRELDALLLIPVLRGGGEEPTVSVRTATPGEQRDYSSVRNAQTAVLCAPGLTGKDGEIRLPFSTRHRLDDFCAFARLFGWECRGQVRAPESTFHQLLLQKVE